jgi:hypothetical protein
MPRRLAILVLSFTLVAAAPLSALAASPWASEVTYTDQALGKLGFGLKNFLLSWTDLFREPIAANNSGENVFVGIGQGLVKGVGNTVLGAAHAVTFPLTFLDVPLIDGGTDVM